MRPQFKAIGPRGREEAERSGENKQALLHPDRIREITQYIPNNFRQKTHRLHAGNKGFNAMFAVSSVMPPSCITSRSRPAKKSDKPLRGDHLLLCRQ